jgi:DNA-binding XRE family transcriptional regulator
LVACSDQAVRATRHVDDPEAMPRMRTRDYDRPMTVLATRPAIEALLREWRRRRRLSQLELALRTNVSSRHLSFVETGRSPPSAEMVLRLAEELAVPLRQRNDPLLAAHRTIDARSRRDRESRW